MTCSRTGARSVMGFVNDVLVPDCDAHAEWAFADGTCPLVWRQGVKHDAGAVMELCRQSGSSRWQNRLGEQIDVEPERLYPLKKAADLALAHTVAPERAVIVTQGSLGQDTTTLARDAPRLWSYLQAHQARFQNRKSSIYRDRPPFAIFGIGPYSFAPYKVAVSGMHKTPRFRAVPPRNGRPFMLDDTCYFLPCHSAAVAAVLTAICNDPIALGLISTMSFRQAKRPITKAVLQRLDLAAIIEHAQRDRLLARALAVLELELHEEPGESVESTVDRLRLEFATAFSSRNEPPHADEKDEKHSRSIAQKTSRTR